MKKLLSILILSTIIFSACQNQEEEPEESKYLPREKMVLIMADIQITEAYIDELKKTGKRIRDTSLLYYEKVFKKHQISPLEFEESLLWYKKDFDDLDLLYTEVITRLNELKAKNEELILQMKADSARADSIARAEFVLDSIQSHLDSLESLEIINNDSLTIE